ncbi:extracellular catalytic domain type 1 short-chain-length polyhydroxyalkanoate depolymerase [Pararhizobium antarcticum]|uniref:Esterase n=1 Tax=Pararhizobium antarcticum TaxID=1798805 RepID=A0A657LT63_9HYPH|nr:PHB depolymerase family esterase [Pararhizobium antarcticum]OJF96228.1 hypothetical protein AX761_16090 [Rhizobium sp. 58]OJF97771.1 hypothetical protein AX760_16050 [Pararhizobium antarcticum]
MRSISDTIARLSSLRSANGAFTPTSQRLADFSPSGSNPGALEAKIHIPKGLAPRAALVVVLHGCTQTADAYDHGSGWSHLADDHRFAVLYPQQTRANNPNACFNWFVPGDIRQDGGEAASIRQMIETAVTRYDLDRDRIFITGLSAGGAMVNVMLATNPDLFVGGAIIAGLPYGTAATIPEAFDRMRGHGMPTTDRLQDLVSGASNHKGPWPTVSVWQGTKDTTVVPSNALSIIEQWRGIHSLEKTADRVASLDGHTRQAWTAPDGREVLEFYSVRGMGHGTPLDVTSGYGKSAPYMLDVGISSTLHIARFWGLVSSFDKKFDLELELTVPSAPISQPAPVVPTSGIQKTIEDALRAAGLMK